jgi:tetratricopeptide (TPR) repeat protein
VWIDSSVMRQNRVTLILVGAAAALLASLTVLLQSLHASAKHDRVSTHVARAQAAASMGDLERGVAEYRAALQLDRTSVEARRALALALVELGRLGEGESYLSDLLRDDPINGLLNRGLARIHVRRDRVDAARTAYHRAIYGEWPGELSKERIETRFEFIEFLTKHEAREEVLAELVRLRAELPSGQTAAVRRTADLLAAQGAGGLAIDMLRTAAVSAPKDIDLLAHLADVEIEHGRPTDARATLRRALALDRTPELTERLALVERVLEIDPTLPGLRLVTRTRRARLVLSAVQQQTEACATEPTVAALRTEAAQRLRRRATADAEDAEAELALAARLWAASPNCHADTPAARALTQVLNRVTADHQANQQR